MRTRAVRSMAVTGFVWPLCLRGAGIAATLLLVGGCGLGHRVRPPREERKENTQEKIDVEAYLFDARLLRRGKPTSFRLEVFQTDSVIALGGRAYLGKGALKGRLTADSLELYFPSSNEYLYEHLDDLFAAGNCSRVAVRLGLLHLFSSLPDSQTSTDMLVSRTDDADRERPEYLISAPDCSWRLALTYERQPAGWRIRKFVFDDGKDVVFKADRRTYKKRARVPDNKFRVVTPHDAVRIVP